MVSTCVSCRFETLRASVGMVFEDALLFTGSIRDNIAFGVPDAAR